MTLQFTAHRKYLLIIGFFVLLFAVGFRFASPSPAYAACTPPGAGWQCTEQRTPIYGTCYREQCDGSAHPSWCGTGDPQFFWCGGKCCWGTCYRTPYTCITGWNVQCVCLPPAGCNGTPCPPGFDCISGACVPIGGDGGNGGGGSCSAENPCPSDYECIGGVCSAVCQKTGSGTKCSPDMPNNNCPSGEVCCWGVGECYSFCCGGGGHTPRDPAGVINLSPKINDPASSQYFFTKTGLEYKDYFYRRGYDPGLANWGKATVCVRAGDIAETPEATSCDFGRGIAAGAHQWFNPDAGCTLWRGGQLKANFSPGGGEYNYYGGGNFIMLHPTRDNCRSNDDYPCKISVRFRAPADQLLRAIEFDYDNNVHNAYFGFARYSYGHFRGDCPWYAPVPDGSIPTGGGHKIVNMPGGATKDAWLVLDAEGWYQPNWAYRAIIYNIKLHLIRVDTSAKATIDVVSNVVEPGVGNEPHHMDRVRFSNDSVNWSSWVYLDQLSSEGRWVYPWTLGNPSKTVWMAACTIHDTCTVFSDSIEYNPFGTVSGYIWNDLNNSNGTGRDPPTEPNYTASTIAVSYSCPSGSGSVNTADGNYTFNNIPAESCTVSIGPLASGWSNTTPASVGVTVPAGGTATANFGVWDNPDPWIQGCNGDAYGLGVSVLVPYECKGCCDRWFLGADPNDTAGGVVISGNATLSCNGRCSERPSGESSLPGWNAKDQVIGWPSSLSFSSPSDAINISTAFSFPIAPQFTLQKGKSYIWNLGGNYFDKIYQNPTSQGYRVTGAGYRVAVIYVPADRTPFTIHPRFQAYKADGTLGESDKQGVIFVVDGDVVINTGAVAQALNDDTPNLEAVIIASGKIEVYRGSDSRRRIVKGMLYGKGGISVTGPWELKDNLYPVLKTIYNSLYFDPSNPLAKNSILWREVAP